MVEVFWSNFDALFPEIEFAIKDAAFVAIDTEFTGLVAESKYKPSLFDSAEERYKKLRTAASSFIICQLGLSAFSRHKVENKYEAQTYVFYIRPRSCGNTDSLFSIQASCVEFLCRHNFDFNKFAYDGVPYLNEIEENQVKKDMYNGTLCVNLDRDHDKSLLQKVCSSISVWLSTAKDGEEIEVPFEEDFTDYFFMHELRQRFPAFWIRCKGSDTLVAQKISSKMQKERDEAYEEEKRLVLKSFLGFSRLFRVLVESKKPIVGHNLLMDLLMFYNYFYRPLPTSYSKFKHDLNQLFPVVFDTKSISQSIKKDFEETGLFNGLSLKELYISFRSPKGQLIALYTPYVEHITGERYGTDIMVHEAGFDAFASGFVFLRMAHLLASSKLSSKESRPFSWKEHLQSVKSYQNKLNLIRAQIHHLNLGANDPPFTRPQWLYVQTKTSEKSIQPTQLAKMFSTYGIVDVKAVSKRAALVAVGNYICAKDILGAFCNHEDLLVTKYSVLKHCRCLRMAMWATCFLSATLGVVLIVKTVRSAA